MNAMELPILLGSFVTTIDDDSEEQDVDKIVEGGAQEGEETLGVMKSFMKAIMLRFRAEASPDFLKKNEDESLWLHQYLQDHEFWIRSECAQKVCNLLDIPFCERAYYRDIRVWFPDVEGGMACTPPCPTCKRQSFVRIHGYPTHHPGHRVITFDSCIYILSRQYCCTNCKKDHEARKEAANGQPFERVQYTFMATNEECLKQYPQGMLYRFPAVLTHRAGMHVNTAESLCPLQDKGLRPDSISDWLLELHSLRYMHDVIAYELELQRKRAFQSNFSAPMFSDFDDKTLYNGGVPTGAYVSQVYKQQHQQCRPHMDREVKKVDINQISLDASFKAPKMLNGKRTFEALQTFTTGNSQIRMQVAATSDCHEELLPALEAMIETQKALGKALPKIATTDNPKRDKEFLLKNVESLRETQAILDKIAAEMNARDNVDGNSAALPSQALDSNAFDVEDCTPTAAGGGTASTSEGVGDTQNDSMLTAVGGSTASSSDSVGDVQNNSTWTAAGGGVASSSAGIGESQIQVVACGSINDKIEALQERMERGCNDSPTIYALDCEWHTTPCGRDGWKKKGNVALLQIGYCLGDDEEKALLLQLPRQGKLPNRLVAFLKDPNATFVGVNVKNNIDILGKDFGIQNLSNQVSFVDLGMFARERDVVEKANRSLADIVEIVLGDKLNSLDTGEKKSAIRRKRL
jgi:hypothetical protein